MIETAIDYTKNSSEINNFISKNSLSLIYQTNSYINLISKETNSVPVWIKGRDSSGLRGVLPLMIKYGSLGPVVNSLPYYGGNGGVIVNKQDKEVKREILSYYDKFCDDIDACSSTIVTNPLLQDHNDYKKLLKYDFIDERIGQFTFFPENMSSETLMKSFENPRPRNIRKALQSNITITCSNNKEALDFLYFTHKENILSINGKPKTKSFFQSLYEIFPKKSWKIYIASIGTTNIAALLVLYNKHTVEYFTPCIVEEYRSKQPLSLLIYQAMIDSMVSGYKNWNWGGTWISQKGVYDFKKKWGTLNFPYFYFNRVRKLEKIKLAGIDLLLNEYENFFVIPYEKL